MTAEIDVMNEAMIFNIAVCRDVAIVLEAS